MKLILENWRQYSSDEELNALLTEIKLFQSAEQSLLVRLDEARATWGDLAKFVAAGDPTTFKNRMKKMGKGAVKAAAGIGITVGAVALAPKILAGLGIAAAGPAIATKLVALLGDDISSWTEEQVGKALEKVGALGMIGVGRIMGAVDKVTAGSPLSRLNISDSISNIVEKDVEEKFYTFMNQYFKQNPNGPNGDLNEVIPKRWANRMFSKWLAKNYGATAVVNVGAGGDVDVAAE